MFCFVVCWLTSMILLVRWHVVCVFVLFVCLLTLLLSALCGIIASARAYNAATKITTAAAANQDNNNKDGWLTSIIFINHPHTPSTFSTAQANIARILF